MDPLAQLLAALTAAGVPPRHEGRLRVVVLGAGFGGLEVTSILSDALGDELDLVLVDQGSGFVFGFAKLDVMFGHLAPDRARHPYTAMSRPGVRFVRSTVREIDPGARRVVTDDGTFDADVLVVALGADMDPAATPGLVEAGHEFYSVAGAEALREQLPRFAGGSVVVGVTSTPFKCPPAPSETALMMHDFLTARGIRDRCSITLVMPFGIPVPPSPAASQALLSAFAESGVEFVPDTLVRSLDAGRSVALLSDSRELPYDLFLGVPMHRVPPVVEQTGLALDGWVPVDPGTLLTRFPDVYAVGDVTSVGTPKAGVFAEGAARVVAEQILAQVRGTERPDPYDGTGTCYIEFGHDRVARVDVTFLGGSRPSGTFEEPSAELAADKALFGSSRVQRWFGT